MEKAEILNEVTRIFRKELENDAILLTEQTTANDIDEWDSLNHTILVNAVQKHFNVKFKLMEVLNLENIGDLCELIDKKLREN